jgi:tape measure domain-containing protein
MAVNVGSAYGIIALDYSPFERGIEGAKKALDKLDNHLKNLENTLSSLEQGGFDSSKIQAQINQLTKATEALNRANQKTRTAKAPAPAGEGMPTADGETPAKKGRSRKAKVEVDTTEAISQVTQLEQKLNELAAKQLTFNFEPVSLDTSQAQQQIQALQQQGAFAFSDSVEIDTLKAQEKLKALEQQGEKLDQTLEANKPKIDIDTSKAQQQTEQLEQAVEKVGKKRGRKPKVEVDTTEAETKVDGLEQKIEKTTKGRKKTKVDAETAGAEESVDRLGKKVKNIPLDKNGRLGVDTSGAEAQVASLSQKLDALKSKLESAGSTMQSIGGQLSMLVTAPITLAGGAAISTAANFEQLEVAFATMLGSAEKAKVLIEDIKSFSAATPFQFSDIQEATKILIAFGSTQEGVFDEMRGLGDIAAGTGAPLKELALLYGKARASQTLYTMDLMELANRGIPIFTELAKMYGVTEAQVKKMAENGQLHFSDLQQVIKNLTGEGGRFAGLMEAQSKTLSGLFSTLKDNIELALGDIGASLIETFDLKGKLAGAIEVLEGIRNRITDFVKTNPELAKMGFIFLGIAAAIGPLLIGLGGLMTMLSTAIGGLTALAGVFSGPVVIAFLAAGAALYALISDFERVQIAIEDMVNNIGQQFGSLQTTFGGNLGVIVGMFAGAVESVASYGSDLVTVFADGITSAVGVVVEALQYLGSIMTYWLQPNSPPRILPNLDLWGKGAADVYLQGWEKADFQTLQNFGSDIEKLLKTAVDLDQIGELDANKALMSLRDTMANAIEQINQTGSVSPEFFEQIKNTAGVAGEEVARLAELYLKQAEAQERVKKAQEAVASASEKLTAIQLAGAKETAGGGRKGKMSEQMRQQIRAAQNEKAAAEQQLQMAEQESSQAQDELDIFKERLNVATETRDLLAEQLKILEEMNKAGEEFAKKVGGAGKAALKALTTGIDEAVEKLKNAGKGMEGKSFWEQITEGLDEGKGKWQEILDNFRNENGEIDIAIILGKATGVDVEKLQERFDMVEKAAKRLWDTITDIGQGMANALSPVIEDALPDLEAAFTEIGLMLDPLSSLFADAFDGMSAIVSTALRAIAVILVTVIGGLIRGITAALPGIAQAIRGILEIFAGLVKMVKNAFGLIIDIFTGNWGTDEAQQKMEAMKEGFWMVLNGMWNIVSGVFSAIYGAITGFISGAATAAINYLLGLEGDSAKTWEEIKTSIYDAAKSIYDAVVLWVSKMYDAAVEWFTSIKDKAVEKWEAIKTTVAEKVALMVEAIKLLWNEFGVYWLGKLLSIYNDAVDKFEEVKTAVSTKIDELKTALMDKVTEILGIWTGLYDEMALAVNDKFGFIITAVSDKMTEVINTIKGFVSQFVTVGTELINGIRDGFVAGVAGFINAVSDAMGLAEDAAKEGGNKQDKDTPGGNSGSGGSSSSGQGNASTAADRPAGAASASTSNANRPPAGDTVAGMSGTRSTTNAPAGSNDPQMQQIINLLKEFLARPSSVSVIIEGQQAASLLQTATRGDIEAFAEKIADVIQRRRFSG